MYIYIHVVTKIIPSPPYGRGEAGEKIGEFKGDEGKQVFAFKLFYILLKVSIFMLLLFYLIFIIIIIIIFIFLLLLIY